MSWITLTEADVYAALNDAEVDACRAQTAADQDDPLPTLLADVTAEVRGYVGAVIDLAGTTGLPHTLKNPALDILVYRLAKRCQTDTVQQRKAAYDDAVALLRRVAEGLHGLDIDEDPPGSGNWGSQPNIFL